jgi:predicted dehydrogenase
VQSFELTAVKGYSGVMGLEYVQGFADAVLKGQSVAISGEDGVAALRVVEAVYRSDREQRWVTVG